MFGKNRKQPIDADVSAYMPDLLAFARERYVKYTEGEKLYSLGNLPLKEKPQEPLPFQPEELKRDPSAVESPAMQQYYHSWEKQKGVTTSFSADVARRVREKYPEASAFYRPAGIDKRTFHKIKSDYLYKPSKTTAVKCCLGLKLNAEEAAELMKLAGYSLSPSDPSDLAVMFCLEKGIWDLDVVNALMASFDLKDLDGIGE